MSKYSDYIVDYPKRCQDILKHFGPQATEINREVTLILMAASSSFLVPHERLESAHPSQDSTHFETSLSSFKKEINVKWGKSSLSKGVSEWQYGTTKNIDSGPDNWKVVDSTVNEKDLSEVLKIVRNGLAHGNLFTEGNPIYNLVFYSEIRKYSDKCIYTIDGYKFLKVPVDGFKQFLCNWFDLLNTIDINYRDVLGALPQTHE